MNHQLKIFNQAQGRSFWLFVGIVFTLLSAGLYWGFKGFPELFQ